MGQRHRPGRRGRPRRRPTPSGEGSAAWVDATEITPEDESALAGWLADPERPKALHDAKGPLLALEARGWPLAGLAADTALSAYLSHPDQRSYDLADLTLRYLHRELSGENAASAQLSFDLDGDSTAATDAMAKAHAVTDLAGALDTELESRGGTRLLAEVELPLVEVLARMERDGHRGRRRSAARAWSRSSRPRSGRPPTTPTR